MKVINKATFSEKKLKKSAEHIYYEIWMFVSAVIKLVNAPQDQFQINVLLESFSIHLRNLSYFFYTNNRRNSDDMLAIDFISNVKLFKKKRTPKSKLSYINKRVHKQIVHLTYHRNRYNKKTKPWKYGEIYKLLFLTINAFYESLPDKRKNWQHFVELKNIIDNTTNEGFNKLIR